jgi:hypothetical protein
MCARIDRFLMQHLPRAHIKLPEQCRLRTLLEPSADRVQKSIFDTLNCPVGGARVAEVFASYSLQQLLDIQADRSLMPALNEVKRIYHLAGA